MASALRDVLFDVLQMDVGDAVEEDGIIFTNEGKGATYSDMDTLILSEDLKILSFNDAQGSLKVKAVKHLKDALRTFIIFDDQSITFVIYHNTNLITEELQQQSEQITTPYATAYCMYIENDTETEHMVYFLYDNDTYLIKCPSKDTINSILNSITSPLGE